MARAVNPLMQAGGGWSYKQTTPLLLAHAVKHHGWGFIPNQGTPPHSSMRPNKYVSWPN